LFEGLGLGIGLLGTFIIAMGEQIMQKLFPKKKEDISMVPKNNIAKVHEDADFEKE
jgi:hypothetical protein